jgi:hypothetical protein
MIRIRFTVVAFLAFFSTIPLFAQVYDTFVVPVIGSTSGGGGSKWATDMWIFNPQGNTLKVSFTYLPTGGGQGSEVLLTLPANMTGHSADILWDFYGKLGSGSLLVATFPGDNPGVPDTTVDRSFLVRTSTYNYSQPGTYGQAITGSFTGMMDYATEQVSGIANGVSNYGTIGKNGFRANVGALNTGRFSVTLQVSVYDAEGKPLISKAPFFVPPQGHFQDTLPISVKNGSVEFFVVDGDPQHQSVVFPYVSMADNISQDPQYIEPILLATPKYLYGNLAKIASSPTEIGRKIDTILARQIVATAQRVGTAHVDRTQNGRIVMDQ